MKQYHNRNKHMQLQAATASFNLKSFRNCIFKVKTVYHYFMYDISCTHTKIYCCGDCQSR